MKKTSLTVAALVAIFSLTNVRADDLTAWQRRMPVTLNYSGGEMLTDFPVLVTLPATVTQEMKENGADLRFATMMWSELSYEIDTWNTNGVSKVWVKIPQLTADTHILVFWGNSAAVSASNVAATWSNGYVGVWHLNGTQTPVPDASPNANNLTPTANVTLGAAGVVGTAAAFPNNINKNYYLSAPNHASMNGGSALTLEAWGYDTAAEGEKTPRGLISKRTGSTSNQSFSLFRGNGGDSANLFFDIGLTPSGNARLNLGSTTLKNEWMSIAVTFDGAIPSKTARVTYYRNGQLASTPSTDAPTAVPTYSTTSLYVGTLDSAYAQGWLGSMDEVRVSSVARSAAWLKACYDTMTLDTFAVNGTPESNELPDTPTIVTSAADNITLYSADIPGLLASTGDAATVNVYLYWGTSNGYDVATDWNGARVPGDVSALGAFSTTLSGLQPETRYWARYALEIDATLTWSAEAISFSTPNTPRPVLGAITVVSTPASGTTLNVDVIQPGPNATLSLDWKKSDADGWTSATSILNPVAGSHAFNLPGTEHLASYAYVLTLANDFGNVSSNGTFSPIYVYTWVAGAVSRPWSTAANWDLNAAPNGVGDAVVFLSTACTTDISGMGAVTLGSLTFSDLSGYNNITIRATDQITPFIFDNAGAPARITVTGTQWGQPTLQAPLIFNSETQISVERAENNQALDLSGSLSGTGSIVLEKGVLALYAAAGATHRVTLPLSATGSSTKFYRKRGSGTVVIDGGVHTIPLAAGWNGSTDAIVGGGGTLVFSGTVITNTPASDRCHFFADAGNTFIATNKTHFAYRSNITTFFAYKNNSFLVYDSTLLLPTLTIDSNSNAFRINDGGLVKLQYDNFAVAGSTNLLWVGNTISASPSTLNLNGKTLSVTGNRSAITIAAGGVITNGNITVGTTTSSGSRLTLQGGVINCNTLTLHAGNSLVPILAPVPVQPIIAKTASFKAGAKIIPANPDNSGATVGVFPLVTANTLTGADSLVLEAPRNFIWKLDTRTDEDGRQTLFLACHQHGAMFIVR